jgi:putative transposase
VLRITRYGVGGKSRKKIKNNFQNNKAKPILHAIYIGMGMYKKRKFVDGAFYHVTSRTNDKIRVFENNVGRKIMLIALQDAKEKFHFRLTNFCVMPTHIHLLIQPPETAGLNVIMQWIKTNSAKHWNYIHGSKDHLWGNRYFARAVRHQQEYDYISNYIDQNAVVAGLAQTPEEWKASAAFYKHCGIIGLVDLAPNANQSETKLLPILPCIVSNLLPPVQLKYILHYIGVYAVALDKLYTLIYKIPKIGETKTKSVPVTYLHYYTNTHNYYIYEYDGEDTMFGKTFLNNNSAQTQWHTISLSELKENKFLKLELP